MQSKIKNQKSKIEVTLSPELRLGRALRDAGVNDPTSVEKLTVTGTLEYDDSRYIGEYMYETLKEMDMGKATIEGNIISSYSFPSVLTSIILPDTIEFIGLGAFSNKSSLTSVIIPDSVVSIGDYAFSDCSSLTAITIPCSVLEISESAFAGCNVFITVHPDNPAYTSQNGKIELKEVKSASGQAGELQWEFADGVLTVSGNGEIPDYIGHYNWITYGLAKDGASPWLFLNSQIKKIVFSGNISQKGFCAFMRTNPASVIFEKCDWDVIARALNGYEPMDVYSFYYHFQAQMVRMLSDFRKLTGKLGATPGRTSLKEWDEILERMIFCFSEMQKNFQLDSDEIEKLKDEGFELLRKYFYALWL